MRNWPYGKPAVRQHTSRCGSARWPDSCVSFVVVCLLLYFRAVMLVCVLFRTINMLFCVPSLSRSAAPRPGLWPSSLASKGVPKDTGSLCPDLPLSKPASDKALSFKGVDCIRIRTIRKIRGVSVQICHSLAQPLARFLAPKRWTPPPEKKGEPPETQPLEDFQQTSAPATLQDCGSSSLCQ